MRDKKTVRLSLEVTPEMDQLIATLADSLGTASKSEVLRRAVMMMKAANEATQEGKHVGIARRQEDLETEFIGI